MWGIHRDRFHCGTTLVPQDNLYMIMVHNLKKYNIG